MTGVYFGEEKRVSLITIIDMISGKLTMKKRILSIKLEIQWLRIRKSVKKREEREKEWKEK